VRTKVLCLLAAFPLAVALAGDARAQDAAVTWSCQPREGVFVIHYYESLQDAPAAVRAQHPLEFYSLLDVDKDSMVTDSRSKQIVCQLGKDKLEITLDPGVPNVNLLGMCGGAITGILSIKRNGVPILTEEPFENIVCHERERRLDVVTVRNGSAKPELTYGRYDQE
jgi:hypothetical protein